MKFWRRVGMLRCIAVHAHMISVLEQKERILSVVRCSISPIQKLAMPVFPEDLSICCIHQSKVSVQQKEMRLARMKSRGVFHDYGIGRWEVFIRAPMTSIGRLRGSVLEMKG
jgi:hypothetical protein